MAKSDELVAARNALAKDFQHLTDLSTGLSGKLHDTHDVVAQLQQDALQLHSSSATRVTAFDDLLNSQCSQLFERLGDLSAQAGTAHGELVTAIKDLHELWSALDGQLSGLSQSAVTLAQAGAALETKAVADFHTLLSDLDQDRVAIDGSAQQRVGELGGFDGHLLNLQKDWSALLDSVAQGLGEGNSNIAAHVQQHLHDELGSFAEQFQQALSALTQHNVQQVTEEVLHEMSEKLEHTLTDMADQAISALQQGLQGAIEDVLGSRDLTDTERQLMEQLIEPIQPMIDDFIGKVINVQGIWSAVEHLI